MARRPLDSAELKTRFFERFFRKPARVAPKRPTFTFTFDDVPASALCNGVPILDEHGVKGTFYIAAELADPRTSREEGDFVSLPEALELDSAGHHIGCHTYSHYSLDTGSARGLEADTRRNRETLAEAGLEVEDFSYPFGEISLSAKRRIRQSYRSLRGNRPGKNRDQIDLAFLRAERIYSQSIDRAKIEALIEDCERNGGWLIFYTHGVIDTPGPWDATLEDFRWVVERCLKTSGEVLDLRTARQEVLL